MLKHVTPTLHFAALVGLLTSCGAPALDANSIPFSTSESALSRVESTETGNGSPRRFELELVSDPSGQPVAPSPRDRVFLPSEGRPQIYTRFGGEGSLQVIDGDAIDGVAALALPRTRSVGRYGYAVAVMVPSADGQKPTPGCIADAVEGELFCGTQSRAVGADGAIIRNVSNDLLSVEVDLDADGGVERLPLFDPTLEGLTWAYDDAGARAATIGFFPLTRR